MTQEVANSLTMILDLAKRAGADAADVLSVESTSLSVSMRLGTLEGLERSESGDLGLRVFVGKKQAIVSATDRSERTLKELAIRAVDMARQAPEDQHCGLASPDEITKSSPELKSDTVDWTAEQLIERVREVEDAARAVPGVTNSAGAQAGWGRTKIHLAASNGFSGSSTRTGYSLSASVLAGEGTGMQRDYEADSRVFAADLAAPADIGRKAGERAVRRLNPRKMPTARVPVFFDPRISGGLVSAMIGAISGAAIARGTSFLKDKLGQKIFSSGVSIIDDPFLPKGLRSRAFDIEGLLPQKRKLIDDGVLTTWLLDLRSARQLGLKSTAHAARGTSGPPSPSPTNVYMEAGAKTSAEVMKDVAQGLYVTETMGSGVNGVTGDYSVAAAGFWIENGEIAFPVSEMTIAGNLKDMFLNLTPANDLDLRYGINAPTLRIEGMTVAGE
ncbi:MAG: TldD/PmbA family protein [Alphaproteobacteria bacterium]|nr:TldD/PmbA family protein [Alphaproteobacteria bacterium]